MTKFISIIFGLLSNLSMKFEVTILKEKTKIFAFLKKTFNSKAVACTINVLRL
jgi:hypothetical protein